MASGPDLPFDGPLLSDEEIAAAAALDDRLRARTAASDDHAASPNLAAGIAGTVRLLRDVLGRHQNDGIVNCERTLKAATEIPSQAIDSAAQTLPLGVSAPNSDASFPTVRLADRHWHGHCLQWKAFGAGHFVIPPSLRSQP